MSSYKVNIVGASGYVGAELIRIVHGHPDFILGDLFANTKAGQSVSDLFPNTEVALGGVQLKSMDESTIDDCDVLFLALPHTQSQEVVNTLSNTDVLVVDMSADFRFEDPSIYEKWYDTKHLNPEKQTDFVYGLPEVHREKIRGAKFISAPGCYPTSAILACRPFINEGLLSGSSVIVDAASGVSGAGANPSDTTIFTNVDSNFKAYGLINHRHTPEMSKELGVEVLFTPHLLPMTRGIVSTCYIPTAVDISADDLKDIYSKYYGEEMFVHVVDEAPSTKAVSGTNNVLVSVFFDERTKHIVAISAIDNLVKGAAGQGVQAANIALGLEEDSGLNFMAVYP